MFLAGFPACVLGPLWKSNTVMLTVLCSVPYASTYGLKCKSTFGKENRINIIGGTFSLAYFGNIRLFFWLHKVVSCLCHFVCVLSEHFQNAQVVYCIAKHV